jgi:hypothetical protein
MKYTISISIIIYFLFCLGACKNDNASKQTIETDLYTRIEKKIDSFSTNTIPAFSIDRIKKVAIRIEQTPSDIEQVLDTLPDNSTIGLKQINGNWVYYHKVKSAITELYSIKEHEAKTAAIVAFLLFEKMKRENCEHWREICNHPEFPLSPEDKLLCKINIAFYCN